MRFAQKQYVHNLKYAQFMYICCMRIMYVDGSHQ